MITGKDLQKLAEDSIAKAEIADVLTHIEEQLLKAATLEGKTSISIKLTVDNLEFKKLELELNQRGFGIRKVIDRYTIWAYDDTRPEV